MKVFPATTEGHAFSVRWLAPELVHPEEFGLNAPVRSKESDVYAFAMLMYEVRAHIVIRLCPPALGCIMCFRSGIFWAAPI